MKDFMDCFLVLQVHYLASDDIIQAAYRRLCQINHPDSGGDILKFREIQESYETLINPINKKLYLKDWMSHYIHQNSFEFGELKPTLYDITMYHVKEILLNYLSAIQDKDYERAYNMLSKNNTEHLYYKEFMVWQQLIAEIHHLLEFDCMLETFNHATNKLVVTYKVKVKEFNMLLNQVEEDYFKREVIYENNHWRILLNNVDVKYIIRKYKKILTLNKKSARILKKYLPKIEENHYTKLVSKKYFLNNCEYEYLRFLRYKNPFTIVLIKVDDTDVIDLLKQLIINGTRNLDSLCDFSENQFIILLPESKLNHGDIVMDKILKLLSRESLSLLSYKSIEIDDTYESIKQLIETLQRSLQ